MEDNCETCLHALARFSDELAQLASRFGAAQRLLRPAADAFSLTEHLCHLRDLELEGYPVRIRRILDEDLPRLMEIEGRKWAVARCYQEQAAQTALSASRVGGAQTSARV